MREMLISVKKLLGDETKKLILPIVLSIVDSVVYMSIFSFLIITLQDLANHEFSDEKLKLYTIIMLVLMVVRCVLFGSGYTLTQSRGVQISSRLRLRIGDHIRSLNLGYFNKNSIGKLSGVLTTDIKDIETVLTHTVGDFFKTIGFSVMAILAAFYINAWYGIVEYIMGIKTFRLYNLTGVKFERLDQALLELKRESVKTELTLLPYTISFSTVTSFMIPAALLIGTYFLINGSVVSISFLAIVLLSISISNMMNTLGALYPQMKFLNKATENILDVLAEKPFKYEEEETDFSSYDIAFENVSFRYTDKTPVLQNDSFTAKAGTTTALIGPSGSGKTTVVSLISRFWDTDSGAIKIDGKDIHRYSPDSLTRNMAVVFQDVYLLHDTIFNNIRIAKPNASKEEVMAAAKSAMCHDFIIEKEEGYDTLVGEGGSTLSGGEKQRISIARALLKDAPIVLLDETTSSLDADNEKEIQLAFDKLMKDKTVIVIAHRLNTTVGADRIIVVKEGEIYETGNHDHLIKRQGWYAKMYEEQQKARNWSVK